MTSNIQIQRAIDNVVSINGRAFVKQPLKPETRVSLYALASALGIPVDTLPSVPDDELCHLYATARKSFHGAQGVALQIINRLNTGANPLFDPPVQAPIDPRVPERHPIKLDPEPAPEPTGGHSIDQLLAMLEAHQDATREIARTVADERLSEALDGLEELVANEARKAVASVQPTNLIVTLPQAAPVQLGVVHEKAGQLIKMLAAGVNVYLHGPAGSGKTTGARQASEAFKVPFHFAAKVESEYLLLGFKDARGETVRTAFREAYEYGGVFLFDEMDASSPGAIVAINAALANGFCPFPDKLVERHPDFKCIGAGNTTLTGANRQYVGRTQMDAASIDRFAFLDWGYDNALELSLSPNKDWGRYVQRIRGAIAKRGLEHLVTPRATIDGCKLLDAGMTWEEAEYAAIWKGLDVDTVAQIKREAGE